MEKHMTYREEQLTKEVKELQFKLEVARKRNSELEGNHLVRPRSFDVTELLINHFENIVFVDGKNDIEEEIKFQYGGVKYTLFWDFKVWIDIQDDGYVGEINEWTLDLREDEDDTYFVHASINEEKVDKFIENWRANLMG